MSEQVDSVDPQDALWNSSQGPLWERIDPILKKSLERIDSAMNEGQAALEGMDDATKAQRLPETIQSLQELIARKDICRGE